MLTGTWTLLVIPQGTFERLQEYATADSCTSVLIDAVIQCSLIQKFIVRGRCSQGKASIDIVKLCGAPAVLKRARSDVREHDIVVLPTLNDSMLMPPCNGMPDTSDFHNRTAYDEVLDDSGSWAS